MSRPLGIKKRVLFHSKPVNQQKTTIFALILWEEQRLIRFWSAKRCRNSTFTLGSKRSVLPSSFNTYLVMWKYNCEPLWWQWLHWVHKTCDEYKQNKNTIRKLVQYDIMLATIFYNNIVFSMLYAEICSTVRRDNAF